MAETVSEYIERRRVILDVTTGIAERFTTASIAKAAYMTPKQTTVGERNHGMGRRYNAIESIFEAPNRLLVFTSYLVSPMRRNLLGFTDPVYRISFENPESSTIPTAPAVSLT